METKESKISSLGGMARLFKADQYFNCPPWIDPAKWNDYRAKYNEASKGNESLVQVDLELADNCNYRCLECPISDGLVGRKIYKLSDEDIDLVLKSSAKKGALALKLNYINEPMLDIERLLKTAEKAYKYGFVDIYFTTNGSLLTYKNSMKLIESKMISRIQVSLDAFTKETYNKIRRGGNFEKVKKHIQDFIELRKTYDTFWPKIRVSFLTLPENKHETKLFYDYWNEIVDAVALQSSVLKPNSKREDNTKSYDKLRTSYCPNPFRQLVVRADKSVLPCCSFWGDQMKLGTLKDDLSLGDLFNSKKMNSIRNSFKNKDKKLISYCEQCLSSCDPTTND